MKTEEIISRIESLNKEDIDKLFFKCGWSDEEREKNQALPDWRIQEIKGGQGRGLIDTFIQETSLNKIVEELEKLK